MMALNSAQNLVAAAVGLGVFAMMLWALVHCARTRQDAFPAAGKRTKTFWLLLTGGATVVGFIFMLNPFNLFNLAAIVAAGVYHADVKPAVNGVQRGGQGTHMGPYGPW
jgi:hypothetical protein